MKYLNASMFALCNLGWSFLPGNSFGWMNALMFIGCVLAIAAYAAVDLNEYINAEK